MKNKIIKNKIGLRGKEYFFFVLFCLIILIFPAKKICAWTGGIPGSMMHFSMDTIYKQAQSAIVGALKTEAITFLQEEMSKTIDMITGKSGMMGVTQGYISDWEAFLIEEPGNQVASKLEEALGKISGGRTSANYRPRSSSSVRYSESDAEGLTNRYFSYDEDGGKAYRKEIQAINALIAQEKLAEYDVKNSEEPTYERNPRMAFNNKTSLRDFDLYLDGKNNPWTYATYKNRRTIDLYERKRAELALRASIGRGFWSDDDTKAAVKASDIAQATDTSNVRLVENSGNVAETIAIIAFAKAMGVVKNSIRNIRGSYQRDFDAYRKQIMSKFEGAFDGGYPSDVFREQIQQRKETHKEYNTGFNYERVGR